MKIMGYIFIIVGVIFIIIGVASIRSTKSDNIYSDFSATTSGSIRKDTASAAGQRQASKQGKKPSKAAETSSDQNTAKKEAEEKGRKFEEWVVNHFHKEYFILKEWRGDKFVNGTYAESNRYPDLEYKMNLGGLQDVFAVECKWRSKLYDGMEWTTKEKIDIYNQYAQERGIAVFVALGVGGTADNPNDVYLVPLQSMQDVKLNKTTLAPFKRPKTNSLIYYYADTKTLK